MQKQIKKLNSMSHLINRIIKICQKINKRFKSSTKLFNAPYFDNTINMILYNMTAHPHKLGRDKLQLWAADA